MKNRTADQLRDANINTLLPLKTEVRQLHDRKKVLKTFVYPYYLFVQIREIKDFITVKVVSTVVSFV